MYVGILPDGVTLDDLEHCVLAWQLPEDLEYGGLTSGFFDVVVRIL